MASSNLPKSKPFLKYFWPITLGQKSFKKKVHFLGDLNSPFILKLADLYKHCLFTACIFKNAPSIGPTYFCYLVFLGLEQVLDILWGNFKRTVPFFSNSYPTLYVHCTYIVITYFPFRFCFSVYFPAKGSGTCTRASELVPFVTTEETSKEL